MDQVDDQYLKNDEGLRLYEYDDATGKAVRWNRTTNRPLPCKGNRTIGFGHKCGPAEFYPNGITKAKAELLFQADKAEAIAIVKRLLPGVKLNRNQMTVCVSLVFNGGSAPLSGTPGRLLRAGKFKEGAAAFKLYRHGHGKGVKCDDVCDALLKRRERDEAKFNQPVAS